MKEAAKNLATKKKTNAFDFGDKIYKNGEKFKKFKRLIQVIFLVKLILKLMEYKVI